MKLDNYESAGRIRSLVVSLMLVAFAILLLAPVSSALSRDPNQPYIDRPWTANSDGGDEGGWGESNTAQKSIPNVIWYYEIGEVIHNYWNSFNRMISNKNKPNSNRIYSDDEQATAINQTH